MKRTLKNQLTLAAAACFIAACAQHPVPAGSDIVVADTRQFGPLLAGADGGWIIGAHRNFLAATPLNQRAAHAAIARAQSAPATPADVHRSTTADLNHDGFVTADEVVAMTRAGLGDLEIVRRVEATGHVIELTVHERELLLYNGVPPHVVREMQRLVIG